MDDWEKSNRWSEGDNWFWSHGYVSKRLWRNILKFLIYAIFVLDFLYEKLYSASDICFFSLTFGRSHSLVGPTSCEREETYTRCKCKVYFSLLQIIILEFSLLNNNCICDVTCELPKPIWHLNCIFVWFGLFRNSLFSWNWNFFAKSR